MTFEFFSNFFPVKSKFYQNLFQLLISCLNYLHAKKLWISFHKNGNIILPGFGRITENGNYDFKFYLSFILSRIDPDLRQLAYCYGIQTGSYPEWEFVFNRYKNESNVSEKIRLLYGLSCTEKPWILNK